MFAKKLLAIAVAGALGVVAGSAAAGNVVNNRAVEIVGAGAGADPLIAVEANRGAIINRLAVEHAATLASAGISQEAFRHALNSIRADQLLVASLVSSFAEITAIVSAEPGNGSALQRFVALSPRSIMSMSEVPIADAYLVRDGDMLSIVKTAQLPIGQPGMQLVGYFASTSLDVGAIALRDVAPKDGSGTGAGSWIGFTSGGNQATGTSSAVAAGANNLASGQNSFVGAGFANQANGLSSLVIGGFDNRAGATDAMVGAGAGNRANGARSAVLAGGYNFGGGDFSFIGGGGRDGTGSGAAGTDTDRDHRAYAKWAFIGGGTGNVAGVSGNVGIRSSAVAGGQRNTASGHQAFIGGGGCNTATAIGAVVVGGGQNSDTAACTFGNSASGAQSFVGGGFSNTASGGQASVLGGFGNTASGDNSVALGESANAVQANTFVFSDGTSYSSTVANTFNIRATNDIRVDDSTNIRMGSTTRQNITLWGNPDTQNTSYGIGVQGSNTYFRVDLGAANQNGFNFFKGGIHSSTAGDPGTGGVALATLDRQGTFQLPLDLDQHIRLRNSSGLIQGMGAQVFTTYLRTNDAVAFFEGGTHTDNQMDAGTGGSILATINNSNIATTVTGRVRALAFDATSDRAQKHSFAPVNTKSILAKVASLPISSWVYNADKAGARHIGPVSQDFIKAFDIGSDDKSISMVDASGVALAAIKGLNELVKEKDAKIAKLEREMAAIKKKLGM